MLNQVDILVKEEEAVFLRRGQAGAGSVNDQQEENQEEFKEDVHTRKRGSQQQQVDENLVCCAFQSICRWAEEEEIKPSELHLQNLESKDAKMIEEMVGKYKVENTEVLTVEMKIVLKDEVPVYQTARRVSPADKRVVEEQIKTWLQEGIIQPSVSEYASPVVLVAKKDGTKGLSCDYRKLNKKIRRDNFPIAVMDAVIEKLPKAKVFITIDLRNGYFHVPIAVESRIEFLFAPFGISNSPAVFARFIQSLFRDLGLNGTVVIYVDDIIIPGVNIDDCIQKFGKVLERAARYGLRIKWSKFRYYKDV